MPSQSRAKTDVFRRPAHWASGGKFWKKKPRPAPYPCRTTAGGGAFGEGDVDAIVSMLRYFCGSLSCTLDEEAATGPSTGVDGAEDAPR